MDTISPSNMITSFFIIRFCLPFGYPHPNLSIHSWGHGIATFVNNALPEQVMNKTYLGRKPVDLEFALGVGPLRPWRGEGKDVPLTHGVVFLWVIEMSGALVSSESRP